MTQNGKGRQDEELQPATEGKGPLLQRDYWAVLEGCTLRPSEVLDLVAARFCEFPPEELVVFEREPGASGPLDVGDKMAIDIRAAGECAVRVIHRDRNSLTLMTARDHPEAGRITFGAYRNDAGDVVFHIRSRARASSALRYAEFLALGDAMQATTWVDFINNLAATAARGVRGEIHADTIEVEPDESDDLDAAMPTYIASGD